MNPSGLSLTILACAISWSTTSLEVCEPRSRTGNCSPQALGSVDCAKPYEAPRLLGDFRARLPLSPTNFKSRSSRNSPCYPRKSPFSTAGIWPGPWPAWCQPIGRNYLSLEALGRRWCWEHPSHFRNRQRHRSLPQPVKPRGLRSSSSVKTRDTCLIQMRHECLTLRYGLAHG